MHYINIFYGPITNVFIQSKITWTTSSFAHLLGAPCFFSFLFLCWSYILEILNYLNPKIIILRLFWHIIFNCSDNIKSIFALLLLLHCVHLVIYRDLYFQNEILMRLWYDVLLVLLISWQCRCGIMKINIAYRLSCFPIVLPFSPLFVKFKLASEVNYHLLTLLSAKSYIYWELCLGWFSVLYSHVSFFLWKILSLPQWKSP